MGKLKKNDRALNIIVQMQYITLFCLMVGQIVTKVSFLYGQYIFVVANAISVFRCFALDRPKSDTVKDISCLAITLGLILITIF